MKSAWIAYSLVLGSLLLNAPEKLAAREPKLNPCRDLQTDLDDQVNSLHKNQNDALAQCRQTQGKNSVVCRNLKTQQQFELDRLRDDRRMQLEGCNPRVSRTHFPQTQNESCNTYRPSKNDKYPNGKYPEPPYKHHPNDPYKEPPASANNSPNHDGGGKHQYNSGNDTRSTGNSASNSSHSGGSGSSSHNSGGSSTSSASSSHSGGGYSSGSSGGSVSSSHSSGSSGGSVSSSSSSSVSTSSGGSHH